MTYGNVLENITVENLRIQNNITHIHSYIMKHVLQKMMRGRENLILNQEGVGRFSRTV